MKSFKDRILWFIIGAITFGGIGYTIAATNLTSSGIEYLTANNQDVESISDALDELYNKTSKSIYLSDFLTNGSQNLNGYIYYHNTLLQYSANDGSIRYAGANPNNYVCFGSTATTCPATNIYRIIGLIPVEVVIDNSTNPVKTEEQVLYKIIKNDYITSTELGITSLENAPKYEDYAGPYGNQPNGNIEGFYWSGSSGNSSNTWSQSTLNTIGLNGTYLTNLGTTWSEKIATVMWNVGGNISSKIQLSLPKNTIQNEVINPITDNSIDNKTKLASKIGLLYVSDYAFSANKEAWFYNLYNSNHNDYRLPIITSNNWLYRGVAEWVITRNADDNTKVYDIGHGGSVFNGYSANAGSFGVRPTFYLLKETEIEINNHIGSKNDPYRIL